jgi:hypothetical protein
MEPPGPVIISMFEAYKAAIKIELSRKANYRDLEAMATRILASEQLNKLEARIGRLEASMKDLDALHAQLGEEEEQDEIDSAHADDLEISVEKERRRQFSSNSRSFNTDEGKLSGVQSTMSKETISVRADSRLQVVDSTILEEDRPSQGKNRGTIGSSRGQSGSSNRQMLMLTREVNAANDKVNRLAKEFDGLIGDVESVKESMRAQQTLYTKLQVYSETLKHEAKVMGERNEQLQSVIEEAEVRTTKMKEEVRGVVDDYRTETAKYLSRFVGLETEIRDVRTDSHACNIKALKKFKKAFGLIAKSEEQSKSNTKEVKEFKALLWSSEASTLEEISSLKEELRLLKGPVQNYLEVKSKESEVLAEEVRRYQRLFRQLAEEYIAILDVKSKGVCDTPQNIQLMTEEVVRLKQENVSLRVSSTSPMKLPVISTSRVAHRYSKSTVLCDQPTRTNSSLKKAKLPPSYLETLSSSLRESPRRLNITYKH